MKNTWCTKNMRWVKVSIGLVHVAKGNESIRMDCFVTCRRPLRRSHMKFPSCFCSSLSSASFFDEKFDALLFSLDLIGSHWPKPCPSHLEANHVHRPAENVHDRLAAPQQASILVFWREKNHQCHKTRSVLKTTLEHFWNFCTTSWTWASRSRTLVATPRYTQVEAGESIFCSPCCLFHVIFQCVGVFHFFSAWFCCPKGCYHGQHVLPLDEHFGSASDSLQNVCLFATNFGQGPVPVSWHLGSFIADLKTKKRKDHVKTSMRSQDTSLPNGIWDLVLSLQAWLFWSGITLETEDVRGAGCPSSSSYPNRFQARLIPHTAHTIRSGSSFVCDFARRCQLVDRLIFPQRCGAHLEDLKYMLMDVRLKWNFFDFVVLLLIQDFDCQPGVFVASVWNGRLGSSWSWLFSCRLKYLKKHSNQIIESNR